MTNPNDYKSYDREVRQETYTDANGQIETNVTRSTESVNNSIDANPNSYQDGYVEGLSERGREEGLVERDNNNAARGLLIGILLTSVVALAAGTIFFLNQRNEEPTTVTQPVLVPVPSAKNTDRPEKTTIIEKTREVPVERTKEVPVPVPVLVPQQSSPAPQTPKAEISPNATPQQPAAQTTTTPSPSQGSTPDQGTSNNTTPTPDTQSNTSSPASTPSQGSSSPAP